MSPKKQNTNPGHTSDSEETLSAIPTSTWARTSKLLKLTASVGASALGHKVSNAFRQGAGHELSKLQHQLDQAQKIVKTLSEMKGAAMKLGQILSLHGDTLFPKEVTQIFSTLQAQSKPIKFKELEPILIEDLGPDYSKKLKYFTTAPIAAASIGQVHKACLEDGTWVAVKIQYPGVADSIDADIDALFAVLKTVFLSGNAYDLVKDELKDVLKQEANYLIEAQHYERFQSYTKGMKFVRLPKIFKEFSSQRILVTEFISAQTIDQFADSSASLEARNSVGYIFMELYLRELLQWGYVQTDPNFGNYLIANHSDARPELVLLDFGAVKSYHNEWRLAYIELIKASMLGDRKKLIELSYELGFLQPDDSEECKAIHVRICEAFLEPFQGDGPYDFGKSDLPQRMRNMIPEIIRAFDFRAPPKEIIFLNRKMVGIYFFLHRIGAVLDFRPLLKEMLGV